jgi:hypothetical protein
VTASIIPAAPPDVFEAAYTRIQFPGLPWNRLICDGFIAAAAPCGNRACHDGIDE